MKKRERNESDSLPPSRELAPSLVPASLWPPTLIQPVRHGPEGGGPSSIHDLRLTFPRVAYAPRWSLLLFSFLPSQLPRPTGLIVRTHFLPLALCAGRRIVMGFVGMMSGGWPLHQKSKRKQKACPKDYSPSRHHLRHFYRRF